MRWLVAILLMCMEVFSVESCVQLEVNYALDQLKIQKRTPRSARVSYDEANALIDSAVSYLGYCANKIPLDKQYQIRQTMRRTDKKRRTYFTQAVREYHHILGIRPNVREIYQDGGGYSSGGSRSSPYSSPPRMPPVRQPQ